MLSDDIEKEIKLVYLAIPDREHYDSVIEIQVVPSGNNTPNDSERESIVTLRLRQENKQNMFHHQKANPDKWQKNVRKRLRQAGSEYTDTKGKTVEAREMKDIDCNKCRFECSLNTDEDNRRRLFQEY